MKRLKNWQRYALEWSVLAALILVISGILQIGTHPDRLIALLVAFRL